MAKFDWWPNREGLDWFVDSVLPRLPKRIRLNLFGPGSKTVIGNDRRIVRHGYVPEFDGIWAVCDVMICPMLSGSGVNVKLVEALYNRMPVLATHFAARGVQLPDDPAIKLLDGAEEWIAFLSSPAADRLSDSMVPKELAEAFSAHRHSEPVHRFLGNVVKPADGRQA